MRTLVLLAFVLFAQHTSAQCCCAHHVVEVNGMDPVHSGGEWQYTARLQGGVDSDWSMDSVPGDPYTVRLSMPTGCGIEHATWDLRHRRTGLHMQVHLYHLPGDASLPAIRLPWTGDRSLHFDLDDVVGCAGATQAPRGTSLNEQRLCRKRPVQYTYTDRGVVRFEPLELGPWSQEPPWPSPYTATQEAGHIGGIEGMQRYLEQEVDKALVEPLPFPVTFTGHALVQGNGTVRELIMHRTHYAALADAIREALLRSDRWQPEVVEYRGDPNGPVQFQPIRSTVPVRFVADPTTIWRELNASALSILPSTPTTGDSLRLHFHWSAGSCGTYRDSVVISPPTTIRPWTDIAVGIGSVGEDCADKAAREWTIVLPPQPAGRYRVRYGAAPAGTKGIRKPDPFSYREVVVR